ncbi:GlcG/HbpS family heme-binding protein [Dechloromonas denitrificans]|uniref:GlcG/HbpS family heme-binding protein n=1 Tax=Dechloromonas denitrificans TaxID=281362 RepID=UPI001CF9DED6|nr:heme-binding protein [Dechloromonas denitrificans]UCV06029.1 heme-binding protein [Dechloromonas denitrificans]
MKKNQLLACTALLCAASSVFAQTAPATPAPPARGPSFELALEAAQAAIDSCKARDQKAAVSVVDSAGVLRVLLATDGASPRGVSSSTNKAVTALTFKAPTSQLAERVKTDKELADKIAANTNFNARAGGVLLSVGGEVVGAVGVGGARGSNVDEECGLVGVQKIQGRLR